MPSRDLQVLGSLLDQGDWCVERPPAVKRLPPVLIKIAKADIRGSVLFLLLETEGGTRSALEIEIGDFTAPEDYDPTRAVTEPTKIIITGPTGSGEMRTMHDSAYWQSCADGNVGVILVRHADAPPGWPCSEPEPYGYAEHIERLGSCDCCLRTEHVAQPRTLKPGDRLATGESVLSHPRSGANGSVLVHLASGQNDCWISMAARLPIALLVQHGDVPGEMWTLG